MVGSHGNSCIRLIEIVKYLYMIELVKHTNGKFRFAGTTIRSKIPVTELHLIRQTNLSAKDTVALLNEKESYYSALLKRLKKRGWKVSSCLIWKQCQKCKKIFLTWQGHLKRGKNHGLYCNISCRQKVNIRRYLLASGKYRHPMSEKQKQRQRNAMMGKRNWAWKGGVTYFKTHGNYVGVKYVRCPKEYTGMARKDGYVMEHRLLVAQQVGRLLKRAEVVHHFDHNPANNSLNNLLLFASNRDHKLHEAGKPIKPLWRMSQENIMK